MVTSGEDLWRSVPPPHPLFTLYFKAAFYLDHETGVGPFSTDEGADILLDWASHADRLSGASTVRDLLGEYTDDVDAFLHDLPTFHDLAVDSIVVGAGFTLLYYTGWIDRPGRHLVLAALTRSMNLNPNGEAHYRLMTDDLHHHGAAAHPPPEAVHKRRGRRPR